MRQLHSAIVILTLVLAAATAQSAITLEFESADYDGASAPLNLLLPDNLSGIIVLDASITSLNSQSLTISDVSSYDFVTLGRAYDETGTYTTETIDITFDINGDVESFNINLSGFFEGAPEWDRVVSWANVGLDHAVEFGLDDTHPGASVIWAEWAIFEGSVPSVAEMWTIADPAPVSEATWGEVKALYR